MVDETGFAPAMILLAKQTAWTAHATRPDIVWWTRPDLNGGPADYESAALTAELRVRKESERRDLNPRQLAPKASALPDCATFRIGANGRNCTSNLLIESARGNSIPLGLGGIAHSPFRLVVE